MTRAHDMGGQPSEEPIDRSEREMADWERLTNALVGVLRHRGVVNVDELRRGIETMAPGEYEACGYYERWAASLETLLVEKGLLTPAEIDARAAEVKRRWG
ncbi:MAG: nitrile hydratase subunit beta [Gemmatimonadaceae bacterium]|nr:nitrile hydratase subunit beta [Gemmatimonadaceae bacterium]